jgi:hypothetical protein
VHAPAKSKTNPWIAFAAGIICLLVVFMFLAFLVVSHS